MSLNIDLEQNRIKTVTNNTKKLNQVNIFKNNDFVHGAWISFDDFAKMFDEESKNLFLKTIKNWDNQRNIEMILNISQNGLKQKKYQLSFFLQEKSKIAFFSWNLQKNNTKTKIFLLKKPFAYSELKESFSIIYFLEDLKFFQRPELLTEIYKRLHKTKNVKFALSRQSNCVALHVVSKDKKELTKIFEKYQKTMRDIFDKKFATSVLFVKPNFNFQGLEQTRQKLFDFLSYTASEKRSFSELNFGDFAKEKIEYFDSLYKKNCNLILKRKFVDIQEEILNQESNVHSILHSFKVSNGDSSDEHLINVSSLKNEMINRIFPFETDDKKFEFIVMKDYEFMLFKEEEIKNNVNKINQHFVIYLSVLSNVKTLYKKIDETKNIGFKISIGLEFINENFFTLINEVKPEYIFISKTFMNKINNNEIFLEIANILNFCKNNKINVVLENLNVVKDFYKLSKINENFYYTKGEK
ncbi:hypothetical protein WG616_03375 [[Mycoplasma] gypis]|uniref:EAL domain-containing protein n=2 Tax=[Mycoplasma] gypis TaxID=92404 RepID=A0ABZ2RMX4_9BACT